MNRFIKRPQTEWTFDSDMEAWLQALVIHLGYPGIFLATMIESTFVPIPAEVTMIPAGMLAYKGELSYWGVLMSATLGVVAGSAVNYWLGVKFGRALIIRYGKFIFLKPAHLAKTETFFERYGKLAVFLGRVLPGVKHYIAFAAGIARMDFKPFLLYSALGGLAWMWVILQIGYVAAMQEQRGVGSIGTAEIIVFALVVITGLVWIVKQRLMRH